MLVVGTGGHPSDCGYGAEGRPALEVYMDWERKVMVWPTSQSELRSPEPMQMPRCGRRPIIPALEGGDRDS